jgi:energy-coupling factor transporter ATP-binding protein EcfA2
VKVQAFTAENWKRLKVVHFEPEGELIVVGGRNGQGKTSVLDALASALSGSKPGIRKPVREGEERAEIEVITDTGLRIVQRFSDRGTYSITVTSADGAEYKAAATFLERFHSSLSFDPLAFVRAEGKRQVATLARLTGLEDRLTALKASREAKFSERADVNREVRRLENGIASLPVAAVPEPVDVDALLAEHGRINEHHANLAELDRVVTEAAGAHARAVTWANSTTDSVDRLRMQLKAAEEVLAETQTLVASTDQALTDAKAARAESGEPQTVRAAEISRLISEASTINQARAEQDRAAEARAVLAAERDKAEALSYQISEIDTEAELATARATYPITGLGFDADGVTFNGLPLDQASSAEQLKVAVAIGLALNPELRVMLIRDGSLLDDDSLAILDEMATAHDCQMFVERVGIAGATIVIEDGEVMPRG